MKENQTSFHLKEMKLEVTHDCLLNCVHCSSMSTPKSGSTMDWPIFERIFDEAKEMGVREIAFSGGEPLLWDYIEKGISKSLDSGIHTTLYTTGSAPNAESILKRLHSVGLNRVIFSVFGATPADHESVTRITGSFERTIRIVRFSSNIGIHTEFHFVPLSWNYAMLPQIAELSLELGVGRISTLRLVSQGRGGDISDGELSHPQNIELRKIIKNLRNKGYDLRLGSPYNFLMMNQNPECKSGIDRMTIGPDYRIFPCDAFKHISPEDIGSNCEYSNVRNHSLKQCWEKSNYFRVVRDYLGANIAEECSNCSRYDQCNSGCMAQKFYVYGGLIKGPDPMCLKR